MSTVVSLTASRNSKSARAEAQERPEEPRWSGEFDAGELVRPGAYLIAALHRRADELGHKLNEMCKHLGVTYGYINQMRNGIRPTKAISEDFSLACARYLGVPRMTVLVLAGVVSVEDLYDRTNLMQAEVPRALAYLCDDPEWGHLVTPEVRQGTAQTQYLVIKLYEQATQRKLLPASLDLPTLAAAVEQLQTYRAAVLARESAST